MKRLGIETHRARRVSLRPTALREAEWSKFQLSAFTDRCCVSSGEISGWPGYAVGGRAYEMAWLGVEISAK